MCLVGEQVRMFNANRERFKQYVYPFSRVILPKNRGYGVTSILEHTALQIENNLINPKSQFYPGDYFYKCLNTLRATCIDAGVPIVFLVGQFGRELENIGRPTRESRRSMVRLMEPLLETLGLRYWNVGDDSDVTGVADAFEHACANHQGAVLLIDRHLTWN